MTHTPDDAPEYACYKIEDAIIFNGARRTVPIICDCGDPDCRGHYKPDSSHDLAF